MNCEVTELVGHSANSAGERNRTAEEVTRNIVKLHLPWCLAAYLVRRRAASDLWRLQLPGHIAAAAHV